jgi:hypothetical protein
LFGVIGSAGVVRDLNLTDVSVSAGPGARAVGTLAGVNHGTITNIYVTGNVDGGDAAGAWLGGLVGVNGGFGRPGSITAAAVNVGVSSAGSNVVLGGLAAFNSRYWPAPGSEDTELGVILEPEVVYGTQPLCTRVQA